MVVLQNASVGSPRSRPLLHREHAFPRLYVAPVVLASHDSCICDVRRGVDPTALDQSQSSFTLSGSHFACNDGLISDGAHGLDGAKNRALIHARATFFAQALEC